MGYENLNQQIKNHQAVSLTAQVFHPESLSDAWKIKENSSSKAVFIAGGTLIQLQREQGLSFAPILVSLEKIQELYGITKNDDNTRLRIGAMTTIAELKNHPFLRDERELLSIAAKGIGSPAVRNRATIGGNISYGTGDLLPALLALDADLTFFDGVRYHRMFVWEYVQKRLNKATDLIVSIGIPERESSSQYKQFYVKIGRREAFIPSIVTVSGVCKINSEQRVEQIVLTAAGGATPPQRLIACEHIVKGNLLQESLLTELHQTVLQEYKVAFDPFASEEYRKMVAANVIASELESFMEERSTINAKSC